MLAPPPRPPHAATTPENGGGPPPPASPGALRARSPSRYTARMNLFQLILKQMRQRLLSTILTGLSIVLSMALATAILIVGQEGRAVVSQGDFWFDLIVGPKASPLQLVLNTVSHLYQPPGLF